MPAINKRGGAKAPPMMVAAPAGLASRSAATHENFLKWIYGVRAVPAGGYISRNLGGDGRGSGARASVRMWDGVQCTLGHRIMENYYY